MRKNSFNILTVLGAAFLIVAGAGAEALAVIIPITVDNPTFTATLTTPPHDPLSQGTYIQGNGLNIPVQVESTGLVNGDHADFLGWTASNNHVGAIDPTETTSGLSDAGNVGFFVLTTSSLTGEFTQTVPGHIQFQDHMTYTLTADLLLKDVPEVGTFYADLTAGGVRVNGVSVVVDPTQAALGSVTLTFTTDNSPPTGDLGIVFHAEDTGAHILTVNPANGFTQILIDNVSLTETPEPASLSLLAVGGLMLVRRRRQA